MFGQKFNGYKNFSGVSIKINEKYARKKVHKLERNSEKHFI
jgi:hypothetical protein